MSVDRPEDCCEGASSVTDEITENGPQEAEPPPLYMHLTRAVAALARLDPANATVAAPPRERGAPPYFRRAARLLADALRQGDVCAWKFSDRKVVNIQPDEWEWIGNESCWDGPAQEIYWFSWAPEAERRFGSFDRIWVRSCDLLALQRLFIPPPLMLTHTQMNGSRSASSADAQPPEKFQPLSKWETEQLYLFLQDLSEICREELGRPLTFEQEWKIFKEKRLSRKCLRELRNQYRTDKQKDGGRPRKT
jgi:hypothetical protein